MAACVLTLHLLLHCGMAHEQSIVRHMSLACSAIAIAAVLHRSAACFRLAALKL